VTREEFLAAIAAAPDDDGPRLVYADWLTEQDDPQGELIRVQCALAAGDTRPELLTREAALLAAAAARWQERGFFTHHLFRRGFLDEITVDAGLFFLIPGFAASVPWVRTVRVRGVVRPLDDLLRYLGTLPSLRTLDLRQRELGTDEMVVLAASETLARLTRLELGGNVLFDEAVERLAASPHIHGLVSLELSHNQLRDDAAHALAPLGLQELELAARDSEDQPGNVIGPRGALSLARMPLRRLDLSFSRISTEGVSALAQLSGLRALRVPRSRIGPSGAWALAASPELAALEELDLSWNPIGADGANALLASPFLRPDMHLKLDGVGLPDGMHHALAARFKR
jgi:uncharacterized protein (TIGR02996 family)